MFVVPVEKIRFPVVVVLLRKGYCLRTYIQIHMQKKRNTFKVFQPQ